MHHTTFIKSFTGSLSGNPTGGIVINNSLEALKLTYNFLFWNAMSRAVPESIMRKRTFYKMRVFFVNLISIHCITLRPKYLPLLFLWKKVLRINDRVGASRGVLTALIMLAEFVDIWNLHVKGQSRSHDA